jgi:hypothetical protein
LGIFRKGAKKEDTEDTNNEVGIYIEEQTTCEKSDILSYWNNNKIKYPILNRTARDYLCIPSTPVDVKKCFRKLLN